MPRSSRHRSHRSHKHSSKDWSDSEEEERSPKERKPREEDPGAGFESRVSKDLECEKRKSELSGVGNGHVEHGKKRKERIEDAAAADRWSGGGEDVCSEKRSRGEVFGPVDVDKSSKSKLSSDDSKSKSSRRVEGSIERNEESGGKIESGKRRSEKESGRRESSSQGKDEKERDRDRERGSDRDKKGQDSKYERSDDVVSRKHGSKTGSTEEEYVPKKDVEVTEHQAKEESHNPLIVKEIEKNFKRRRDDTEEKDKGLGDGRESDHRKLSSRDDQTKSRGYKDHRHDDAKYTDKSRHDDVKYTDKYRDDVDRDRRYPDDRRDERSLQDHASDKSDHKNFREKSKSSESRSNKSKLLDSDHYGKSYDDDHRTKHRDDRGRKRSSEENEDHSDLKPRNVKESREDVEKYSSSSRFDSHYERHKPEYRLSEKVDSNINYNHSKRSTSSSSYHDKDQSRRSSKQSDSAKKESPSEERLRSRTASTGDRTTASRVRERFSESRPLEKFKAEDDIQPHDLLAEVAASSQYERTPRSEIHTSPNHFADRSPSSTSERRFSDRSGPRRSLDIEVGQKSSITKDRDRDRDRESDLFSEKSLLDDRSQAALGNREQTPIGSSSVNRSGPVYGTSPNNLPPLPPFRLGIDGPAGLGLYEDDNRFQNADRKSHSRHRRSDLNLERGAWKNTPNWPSPVANGFIPLQHGPPGFHPVHQFPAPPLFAVRPPVGLTHTGVSYHMHEAVDRFSGHVRPYGWHNPVDGSCPPHLQVWDGSNGVFGDESRMYGRPEWDQDRSLSGSKGWEMTADTWKEQNGMADMELAVAQKELEYSAYPPVDEASSGQSGLHPEIKQHGSEFLPTEDAEATRSSDTPLAKNAVKSPSNAQNKKTPVPSKASGDDNTSFLANYLSRINISQDLIDSKLQMKCMSILGELDITGACNISKDGDSQVNNEVCPAKRKGASDKLFHSLFPATGDAIFQRAISLYKRQTERLKVSLAASPYVHTEGNKNCAEANDEEKLQKVGTIVAEDTSLVSCDPEIKVGEETPAVIVDPCSNGEEHPLQVSASPAHDMENTLLASVDPADNMEEEKNGDGDRNGDESVGAEEQQSNLICGAVVFTNDSQDCEALVMEQSVNLSRIPNSPGSTH